MPCHPSQSKQAHETHPNQDQYRSQNPPSPTERLHLSPVFLFPGPCQKRCGSFSVSLVTRSPPYHLTQQFLRPGPLPPRIRSQAIPKETFYLNLLSIPQLGFQVPYDKS